MKLDKKNRELDKVTGEKTSQPREKQEKKTNGRGDEW